MSDIFLSYARNDRDRARELARALERLGWSVWWDRKTPPGQSFSKVIQAQLEAARCVVVLWSTASVRSEWVEIEASYARTRGILVPAILEDVAEAIPLEFSRTQAAKLTDWRPEAPNEEFDSLKAAIQRLVPLEHGTIVHGTVRNAAQDEPLEAARVSLSVRGREVATTSDASGRFRWRDDRSFGGESIRIAIGKPGFEPWERTYIIEDGELLVEVALTPLQRPFMESFRVTDASGNPVSEARIVLHEEGDSWALEPTDEQGKSRIELDGALRGRTVLCTTTRPGYESQECRVVLGGPREEQIRLRAVREGELPPWLRGELKWPWEASTPWHGALLLGLSGAVLVGAVQLVNYARSGGPPLTVLVGVSILVAGALYAIAGAISRMRRAPLFFAATSAAGVMALWVIAFGAQADVVAAALVFGGPISAIVGAAVGRLRSPFRVLGMILLGLWPFLFSDSPNFVDVDFAFLVNPVIIAVALCVLAWRKPIEPGRAWKLGIVPFALNLGGALVVYAAAPARVLIGSRSVALVITAVMMTSLLLVRWLNRRQMG